MTNSAIQRRKFAARQIETAMNKKGLTKSQLAEAMGRRRSDVTKWLSGNHNFTNDLLAELSSVLEEEITGVSTSFNSYNIEDHIEENSVLHDSATSGLYLDDNIVSIARVSAHKNGLDVLSYVKDLIIKDSMTGTNLPKVDFSKAPSRLVRKYSGIIDYQKIELDNEDERFLRIWEK